MALDERETKFIEEYLIDPDPARAAIAAGYSPSVAKSDAFCWVSGSKSNRKPHVFEEIKKRQEERAERKQLTADMVLDELRRVAFSDIAQFVKWNGDNISIVPSEQLDKDATRCVSEISQTITLSGGTVKFKLHDKVSALEKLAKHLGLYASEKHEIKVIDLSPEDTARRIAFALAQGMAALKSKKEEEKK